MSTTDHTDHPNSSAPQCPTPVPDPISVLREAVAIIAARDHTPIAEATDQLVAPAHSSGDHRLCVACEVTHLVDPTGHPDTDTGLGAAHQRWAPPPHQRRHPPRGVPERVWATVLGAAAPTRPTPVPPPPPHPPGRTPGRTLKVAGRWR